MDSSIVEVSPASLSDAHEPLSGRSKALRIVFLAACACLLISVSALVVRNAEESEVTHNCFYWLDFILRSQTMYFVG